MKATRIGAALVGVLIITTPLVANAQLFDHMKCYKVKDHAKFLAEVDLTALQAEFGLEHCSVKGKAKLFCVPVDKDVTSFTDKSKDGIPPVAYDGPEYTNDRICYKVKCPKVNIAPLEVTDQFGTRNVEKFKPQLLCTPAVKGVPGSQCGNGVAESGESCDGSDLAGHDCVSQGYSSGMLACDPNCNFDVSACIP